MWLSGLPEPQPSAEAADDVLRRLCELLEVRSAQQLAELQTYPVLHRVCDTLKIVGGPKPTEYECFALFVRFVSFKGLRVALGQLGVQDLNVLSAVLALALTHPASSSTADTDDEADTSTPITTAAAARAGQQSRIYETVAYMSLRSWLDSLSPELAARVASDLGEEVAEDSTLTNALLDYACKHKFVLAESAMSFIDYDKVRKKTTTGKRRKSEPPARTERQALSKRRRTRKSCSDADASAHIDVNPRGEDGTIVEEEDEDEQVARCHSEVEELLVAIGLKPYVAACADKGITPERLIMMTEAELNTELGMSKGDTRHIVSNLRTIREQLEKAGGRPPIRVRRNRPKNKKTIELIEDNVKREWTRNNPEGGAIRASARAIRAQTRDQSKNRAICDVLSSLREMPAATVPSFAQAAPASAGAASDDVASYTSDPTQPTLPELDSRLSHELHPMQEEEEEEDEEELQQLMTPKQESEEDVVDLYLYATDDPPSEDY